MDKSFPRLEVLPGLRLIKFRVTEPTDKSDIGAFGDELKVAVQQLRASGPYFDILADLRGVIVLPQSEIEMGRERLNWMADNGLRKAAHIVGHTLTTLQIRRLATDVRFQYFMTEADALAWLTAK